MKLLPLAIVSIIFSCVVAHLIGVQFPTNLLTADDPSVIFQSSYVKTVGPVALLSFVALFFATSR